MNRSTKGAIIVGLAIVGAVLTGCGTDKPATYADLSAAQQARVDKACHADNAEFVAEHPDNFAHCIGVMVRKEAGE